MPATRMRFLAGTTTRVFNPVTRLVTGRLPGFGTLTHVGRTSGDRYRTPLLVFRSGDAAFPFRLAGRLVGLTEFLRMRAA